MTDALATITAYVCKRPYWEHGEPFTVPADIYEMAKGEMVANMKKRGYPLPRKPGLHSEHFLLFGTPIFPKDD
jgi:hypothetical protein